MIKDKRAQLHDKKTEGLDWYIGAMRETAEERALTQDEVQLLFAVMDELKDREQGKRICPRCCTNYLNPIEEWNALSRMDNETYICDDCATTEALRDYYLKGV